MSVPRALTTSAAGALEGRSTLVARIVERARSAVVVWEAFPPGAPMRLIYVNAAFTDITGLTLDEVAGVRPEHLLDAARTDGWFEAAVRATQEIGSFDARTTLRTSAGRPTWVDVSMQWSADVPEHEHVVMAMRLLDDGSVEEQRFRSLIENISDVIACLDGAGRVVYITPSIHALLGFRPGEVVGETIAELVDPAEVDGHQAVWERVLRTPDVTHGPLLFRVDDAAGNPHDLEVLLTNRLADPAIGAVICTARDVTARLRDERRFRALVQKSSDLIVHLDRAGQVRYTSPSLLHLAKVTSPSQLPPGALMAFVHPDDRPRALQARQRWMEGTGYDEPLVVRVGDGSLPWQWYELECTNLLDDPDVDGYVLNGTDVTERRKADELLFAETAILESIARGADVEDVLARIASMVESHLPGVWCSVGMIGPDGVVRHPAAPSLPPALVALLDAVEPGSSLGEAVRRGAGTMVFRTLGRDSRWSSMHRPLAAAALCACWVWQVRAAGSGDLLGLLAIFTDDDRGPHPTERPLLARAQHLAAIALERDRFESRLEHQAMHDSLTGLPNRTLLLDRIGQALATCERTNQQAAVLFLDLDRFKVINDSLGHAAGDRLLEQVAERLHGVVRAGDTVGRFGGDEFVVLSYVSGEEDAVMVADRLARSLDAPFDVGGSEVVVTCSIGIALAAGRRDPEALVRDADAAMYRAKEDGRNRSALFEEQLHQRMVARLELERDLRAALPEGRLLLHYQPRVRLADGRITGVEALVRWDRAGAGLVGAATLVPVAEETGLIVPIGSWVLEQACAQGAEWFAAGQPLVVAVNLSARQLADPKLVEHVAATLQATGLPPHLLCLEVTESALAEDVDTAAVVLGALKLLGVRLSIDDFGTGYATLEYVRRFSRADELKIDRSFVENLADVTVPDAAIVSAAIVLAHALEFDTVAEGVETAEQLAVLRRLGCAHAQGFYFSAPIPADEVLAFGAR